MFKCESETRILGAIEQMSKRLDTIEAHQKIIEKNQLVAKVTVSVLMGFSLVLAWFIDHANILTSIFDTNTPRPPD